MSNAQEIKSQIVSVKSTQKITKAMQMVAVSKMRKAQDRMRANRPYSEYIRRVVGHIAQANTEYQHPFMVHRDIKRVGIIIVSSDRGLCGGLNTNLFREVVNSMQKLDSKGFGAELAVLGKKAMTFFKSHGGNIKASIDQVNEVISATDLIGGVKVMLDSFYSGEIDQLLIAYNSFENAMLHKPHIVQLVPLVPQDELSKNHWDYIYEPDARALLEGLLVRYIESQVYHAVVENNACEQAARMMAMKNASDNAQDLISELGLIYNKARQAAITQELSEIVSGASAV